MTTATTRTLTIEVPLPPKEVCGNSRTSRREAAPLIAAQRLAGELAAYEALSTHAETLRRPFFPRGVRVAVRVTVRRPRFWSARKLDDPNIQHGLKGAVDGFAAAGVWFNDSQHFFDGPVRWETAKPGEHGVTLTLTEVTG